MREGRTGSWSGSSPAARARATTTWCALALAALGLPAAARATDTLRVPEDFADLGRALRAANPGDTVLVGPGLHVVGALVVDRPLTLRGAGPGATRLAGAQSDASVLRIRAEGAVRVEGLTLSTDKAATPGSVMLAVEAGDVTLRRLALERPMQLGLAVSGGRLVAEDVHVLAPGGHGIHVFAVAEERVWPRPVLRRVVVRDAGEAGVWLCGAGLLEDCTLEGRGPADLVLHGPLTNPLLLAAGRPLAPGAPRGVQRIAYRIAYEEGATAYWHGKDARALEPDAPESELVAQARAELPGGTRRAAEERRARAPELLAAQAAIARTTREHARGLAADGVEAHAEALDAYARALFPALTGTLIVDALTQRAIAEELLTFSRLHGLEAAARWLRRAPAPPPPAAPLPFYTGGLGYHERSALQEGWSAMRRADLAPFLEPLRAGVEPDADVVAAAKALTDAFVQVEAGRHPFEVGARSPWGKALRAELEATLRAFMDRNGGLDAGATLIEVAWEKVHGGSAERLRSVHAVMGIPLQRQIDAWRVERAKRRVEEYRAQQAERERRWTEGEARFEAELAAAAGPPEVALAFRDRLLALAGAAAPGALESLRARKALGDLARRLLQDHGAPAFAGVLGALPETLVGPDPDRDRLLLGALRPAQKLAVLRVVHRDEPWKVGPLLPPLRVPEDHPTIQAAIDAAEPRQEVRVGFGAYEERLRMRPHTRLRGLGATLKHRFETAILAEDCPDVVIEGLTIEPVQYQMPVRMLVLGTHEVAIVKAVRSEVHLRGVTVLMCTTQWAVSFLDGTGSVEGGQLVTGSYGGVRVHGPASDVRIVDTRICMGSGELVAVTGGAHAKLEGLRAEPLGGAPGILVAGAGSRVEVDEANLRFVRHVGGARPDAALAEDLAERDRLVAARRTALRDAYRAEVARITSAAAAGEGEWSRSMRSQVSALAAIQGYPDKDRADQGKRYAPALIRFVRAASATALPGSPEDAAQLDALIAPVTRAFHQRYGVVAFAEVLDACFDDEGLRHRGGEAVARSNAARYSSFLSADDRRYLEERRRWHLRAFLRKKRGGDARGEPEPWPTRWARHRIGQAPVTVELPGEDCTQPRKEANADQPDDGRGTERRDHRHASFWYRAETSVAPLDLPPGPRTRDELERLCKTGLASIQEGVAEVGAWSFERGLPAPYVAGIRGRSIRVDQRGTTPRRWHYEDGVYLLADASGALRFVRTYITSAEGYLEDEELRDRFFRSAQLGR